MENCKSLQMQIEVLSRDRKLLLREKNPDIERAVELYEMVFSKPGHYRVEILVEDHLQPTDKEGYFTILKLPMTKPELGNMPNGYRDSLARKYYFIAEMLIMELMGL